MKEIKEKIEEIGLFLLDMDGTIYLENTPIDGALKFVLNLRKQRKKYLFLTNNSSKNADDYYLKLNRMGFSVEKNQIVTSGMVTGWYLSRKKRNATIFLVGTESLKEELKKYNLQILENTHSSIPDFVVVGFDTELTYNKIRTALYYLEEGATFIATNPDLVCPAGVKRFIPDCGSICILLQNATGKEPIFMGKPHTTLIEFIRSNFNISPSEKIAIIGDRLYTDIAFGFNSSLFTICTLTGEADEKAIENSPYKPDLVIKSIDDLNAYF
ncbi:MAG: HAD-IIA family hydrolase [Chitinispirillaceae bacterium]|nr:HAD-IIA family hydrolase [Chitinispirillaceae bacterium]